VLARPHLQGQAEETVELVKKLRKDLKFRATEELIQKAMTMATEPI
jgi:hypothetical protein